MGPENPQHHSCVQVVKIVVDEGKAVKGCKRKPGNHLGDRSIILSIWYN